MTTEKAEPDVECVARALSNYQFDSDLSWEDQVPMARAVIAAMPSAAPPRCDAQSEAIFDAATERGKRMAARRLADDLDRLCCAETEGEFFKFVTDRLGNITALLRAYDDDIDEIEAVRAQLAEAFDILDGHLGTTLISRIKRVCDLANLWRKNAEELLSETKPAQGDAGETVMQSYPDFPEAIRSNLIDIEIFINDVDAEGIDVENAVNAFNRLVDGIRALSETKPAQGDRQVEERNDAVHPCSVSEKPVTILQHEYDDADMAAVGRAFMDAVEQARLADPWLRDWSPSQCPSEIIFALLNRIDEPLAAASARGCDMTTEKAEPDTLLPCPFCGLCMGYDWNNGTHAKLHGYRRKLLDALNAIKEVPDFKGKCRALSETKPAQGKPTPATERWEIGKNGWDASDEATREDI